MLSILVPLGYFIVNGKLPLDKASSYALFISGFLAAVQNILLGYAITEGVPGIKTRKS